MIFNKVANHSRSDSLSTRLREKRFSLFLSMLSKLEYPIMILDVGGTIEYWEAMKIEKVEGISITILNTEKCEMKNQMFTYIQGDARDLKFPNKYLMSYSQILLSNMLVVLMSNLEWLKKSQELVNDISFKRLIKAFSSNLIFCSHTFNFCLKNGVSGY